MMYLLRFLCLVPFMLLCACAAVTEPMGVEDPFALPRAFAGVARNEAMLKPSFSSSSIVVEVPKGLEASFGGDLQARIIRGLETQDIAAQPRSNEPSWTLRSRHAGTFRGDKTGPAIGVIVWRLFDRDNVLQDQFSTTFTGEVAEALHPSLPEQAAYVAEKVSALLSLSGRAKTEQVLADETISVRVGRIAGAPGDGNRALALALDVALRAKGAKIAKDQTSALWRVDCKVSVVSIDARQERVKLVWTLVAADGRDVGTLVQENPVQRGRLRKRWGDVATFAAEAAADGIWQVLQQIRVQRDG